MLCDRRGHKDSVRSDTSKGRSCCSRGTAPPYDRWRGHTTCCALLVGVDEQCEYLTVAADYSDSSDWRWNLDDLSSGLELHHRLLQVGSKFGSRRQHIRSRVGGCGISTVCDRNVSQLGSPMGYESVSLPLHRFVSSSGVVLHLRGQDPKDEQIQSDMVRVLALDCR